MYLDGLFSGNPPPPSPPLSAATATSLPVRTFASRVESFFNSKRVKSVQCSTRIERRTAYSQGAQKIHKSKHHKTAPASFTVMAAPTKRANDRQLNMPKHHQHHRQSWHPQEGRGKRSTSEHRKTAPVPWCIL